jgi:pentatricopeptide repeat protein
LVIIASIIGGETKLHIDFFLWIGILAYVLDLYSSRATERVTKVRNWITNNNVIDKVAVDCGQKARRAVPSDERTSLQKLYAGHGSSNDSHDQVGYESGRLNNDLHIIDCVLTDGLAHKTPAVLSVMHACIRLGRGDAAVKLFDQMLETGVPPDVQFISKAVSHKFFKLVAQTLDDKRIQEDGLRLLGLGRASFGLDPSPTAQNRLLEAWKNQPPEHVLKYFLEMKSAGVSLSRWAYRYLVVAHERSDPEFAIKVYNEMVESGIQTDRHAYNAVLSACSQLGMYEEARELFVQMADLGLLPSEKTYGVMIKAYSSNRQDKEAVALFETMREQRLEPDRYAYHHAIRSCIMLQRVEYAVELYKDAVQAKMPLCGNTYVLLSEACRNVGLSSLADKLTVGVVALPTSRSGKAPGMRSKLHLEV